MWVFNWPQCTEERFSLASVIISWLHQFFHIKTFRFGISDLLLYFAREPLFCSPTHKMGVFSLISRLLCCARQRGVKIVPVCGYISMAHFFNKNAKNCTDFGRYFFSRCKHVKLWMRKNLSTVVVTKHLKPVKFKYAHSQNVQLSSHE